MKTTRQYPDINLNIILMASLPHWDLPFTSWEGVRTQAEGESVHKREGWVGIIKVPILPLIHNVLPESELTPAVTPKPKPFCQRFD